MDNGTLRGSWEESALSDGTRGETWHSGAAPFPLILVVTGIAALVSWLTSRIRRRTSPDRRRSRREL
jgi:hypothetical protein